ncbi:mCG145137, partial [Mus musculus]
PTGEKYAHLGYTKVRQNFLATPKYFHMLEDSKSHVYRKSNYGCSLKKIIQIGFVVTTMFGSLVYVTVPKIVSCQKPLNIVLGQKLRIINN